MFKKLIKKIIENDYDNIISSIFYFMILFFMPFSSIRWFYIMIAISVVSFILACAHLYFDIKSKKKRRILYWLFGSSIITILIQIVIYIDILTSPVYELYRQ
jgi:hypothetical protein